MEEKEHQKMVDIVIGMQFGDEGKGRIIDLLAADYEIVARFNGGSNAGHTVKIKDKTYIFHLLPSGLLHEGVVGLIGNGVVIDLGQLIKELNNLKKMGFQPQLYISERAHLVLPYHPVLEDIEEEIRTKKIGTTRRGIGPAYGDKARRDGVVIALLKKPDELADVIINRVKEVNLLLQVLNKPLLNADDIISNLILETAEVKDLIVDSIAFWQEALTSGKKILLEGAQGALLDLDFGTYPFVTSSHTMTGGALVGTGLPLKSINRVIGVYKTYISRVGGGPLPTEQVNETGEYLRQKGKEFGATTGRPRRCGWFDGVLARYTAFVSGTTEIILTKLDVLSGLKEIKVASSYNLDGKVIEHPPASITEFLRLLPVYDTLPGWEGNLVSCRSFKDLPFEAKEYVNYLENLINIPIKAVSVGPERDQFIKR